MNRGVVFIILKFDELRSSIVILNGNFDLDSMAKYMTNLSHSFI